MNKTISRYFGAFYCALVLVLSVSSCNNDDIIREEPNENQGVSAEASEVFAWTPAPGQFINDPSEGWQTASSTDVSPKEAYAHALKRLKEHRTVSLGSFGGFIIVGFDHSIFNTGGYEIGVLGNAFLSASGDSNEPGIVYVMQDTNQNGLPDDTWYELEGSETFKEGTIRNYAVTYYMPTDICQPVKWTDNVGNSGEVPYMAAFHKQDTYYPLWIKEKEYTLSGSRLTPKTQRNAETGNWSNPPYDWGYADNMGQDNTQYDGKPNCNRFRISDAIDENGDPVNLQYINFVKIQTGVLATAGALGEVSTEVCGVIDLTFAQ